MRLPVRLGPARLGRRQSSQSALNMGLHGFEPVGLHDLRVTTRPPFLAPGCPSESHGWSSDNRDWKVQASRDSKKEVSEIQKANEEQDSNSQNEDLLAATYPHRSRKPSSNTRHLVENLRPQYSR